MNMNVSPVLIVLALCIVAQCHGIFLSRGRSVSMPSGVIVSVSCAGAATSVSIVPVAQVAPTKPKRKMGILTRTSPAKEPSKDPDVIFKPSLDLAQAMEDYFDKDDNYLLVVYNDNLNKRAYVAAALAEVLGFNSDMSEAVMMQAHMYGYANGTRSSARSTPRS